MSSPSAQDHRRLLRDYADATEQFKATNEVLTALGRSTSDPDAVLDTVVKSARRLCRCQVAGIYLIEGGTFRLASSVGMSEEFVRNVTDFPLAVNRGTVIGRGGCRTPGPEGPRRSHRHRVRAHRRAAEGWHPQLDVGADAA